MSRETRGAPARPLRALARCYPPRLRQRYGEDLIEALEDAWRAEADGAGRTGRFRFWVRMLRDLTQVWSREASVASDRAGRRAQAGPLAALLADARYAWRAQAQRPGFALLVVVMLALGVGANVAVFNALHAVVIRPLPYAESERLVRIFEFDGETPERNFVTAPTFLGLRAGMSSLDGAAALYTYRETGADYTDGERPERVRTLRVSAGYFGVYGTTPFLGREFSESEERADIEGALVSHDFWQTRLAGAHDVLGQPLTLDGRKYSVIGVAPAGFEDALAGPVDVWLNLDLERWRTESGNWYLSVVGRLADGASLAHAADEAERVERALEAELPGLEDHHPYIVPLHGDVVGASGRALALLMGAVVIVLLIACVNVAQLMRVRSLARERELAVRAALGCSRARLVRQLMIESLMLGMAGAAAGLLLARIGSAAWLELAGPSLPRAVDAGLDGALLTFAAIVGATTAALFGLAPALRASRFDLGRALHEAGRGHSAGALLSSSRRWLVATQLALTFVLTVGAGVLTKSFERLASVDLRVETEGAVAFDVSLPSGRYPEPEQRSRFYGQLAERLATVPGVRAAGSVSWLPAQGRYHVWGFVMPKLGDGTWEGSPRGSANQRVVEGRFFEALRIPLLRGRVFEERDDADAPPVVVVNEELVRRYVPEGVDALGLTVRIGDDEREVVGVVADTAIDARGTIAPIVYHPHRQMAADRNWLLIQVVASQRGLTALPALTAELHRLDPDLVVHEPRALGPLYAASISRERLLSWLLSSFAGIAFLLAGLGLFGVLSHSVGQRRRELGVRIALGATAGAVRGLVVRQAAGVAAVGATVGLIGALWASRWLEAFVFETSPHDPATLVGAAVGLVALTLLASYLPAHRASTVDPAEVLRAE